MFSSNHAVFVFLCLIYLTKQNALQVHSCHKCQDSLLFVAEHTHTLSLLLILSSAGEHLGGFLFLTIVSNADINMGVEITFWVSVLYFPLDKCPGEIARSYGNSISISRENFHIVLHSNCNNFHLYQQCKRVPFSSHLCQHLSSLIFLIITILTGMMWYVTVILICICLILSDTE